MWPLSTKHIKIQIVTHTPIANLFQITNENMDYNPNLLMGSHSYIFISLIVKCDSGNQ